MDDEVSRMGSFILSNRPSLSQISERSLSPEVRSVKPKVNIFEAKTPTEKRLNYDYLLYKYGKWNAETYLKILKKQEEEDALPSEFVETKRADIIPFAKSLKRENYDRLQWKQPCEDLMKKHPPETNVGEYVPRQLEPTYKKIFKAAKMRKGSKREEKPHDEIYKATRLTLLRAPEEEDDGEEQSGGNALPQKQCELMPNESNNYLLQFRQESPTKESQRTMSTVAKARCDEIDQHFQRKPMRAVLEKYVNEQTQLVKASLKAYDAEELGFDAFKDLEEFRTRRLDDYNNINEFQSMFDDSRWREKFQLKLMEDSDNANSLDFSDILSSDPATLSGDSLGSELDYRPKPLNPSRIPYYKEVGQYSDALFDRIAMKWERLIMKNFIEGKMKPIYSQYCDEVRLRKCNPIFSEIIEVLEPSDGFYTKKFTPLKIRTTEKMNKMDKLKEYQKQLKIRHRQIESCQIRSNMGQRSQTPERFLVGRPKYLGKNQRHRLHRIIKETKDKYEKVGDCSKEARLQDYINLKPMIRRKMEKLPHTGDVSESVKRFVPSRPTINVYQEARPSKTKIKSFVSSSNANVVRSSDRIRLPI